MHFFLVWSRIAFGREHFTIFVHCRSIHLHFIAILITIIYGNFHIIDFVHDAYRWQSGQAFDFRAIWVIMCDNDVFEITWKPADPLKCNSKFIDCRSFVSTRRTRHTQWMVWHPMRWIYFCASQTFIAKSHHPFHIDRLHATTRKLIKCCYDEENEDSLVPAWVTVRHTAYAAALQVKSITVWSEPRIQWNLFPSIR